MNGAVNASRCSTPICEPKKCGGKAISDEVRALVINAHQHGLSYNQMSILHRVKEDTAYHICSCRQFITFKTRIRLNKESIEFLVSAIERRPDLTLQEVKEMLQQEDFIVSMSTIARKLEGQLVTLKKLEIVPERRNSENTKKLGRGMLNGFRGMSMVCIFATLTNSDLGFTRRDPGAGQ